MDYTGLLTLLVSAFAAFLSYRLGVYQAAQIAKQAERSDKTTGESEFRKNLLELLEQQEEKMGKQDIKIEKQDTLIEQSKALTDELKRANFQLSIENQRLQRQIEALERELSILRAK